MSLLELIAKKVKQKDSSKPTAKRPDEDFIPYVCHYGPNTILTKNGELLQIIRVTGFSNESIAAELISLRDAVRDAVSDHIKDNKVALWFNTIRRKKDITPRDKNIPDLFSKTLNKAWVKENEWNDQYVNELYITIIVEGIDTSVVNVKSFLRSFSHFTIKNLHQEHLKTSHKKLTGIVKKIVADTQDYGAKILGISEWEGVLYSEPMRFFGKVINLYEDRYPIAPNDISNDLSTHKIAFGDRDLEVIGRKNKNFATMLSLKEYQEVSPGSLDKILQLPFEFIITQSFDFSYSEKELESYEYQDYLLQVSGDEEFRQINGSANFVDSNTGSPTDYGKLQTTLMVISKRQEELERDVRKVLEQFHDLGLVIVRENIFLEHCFWSQLPGNFCYLRRQKIINSKRIAGFSALHNFPAGKVAGNLWGSAVTVFRTVLNTPYFFNFHDGKRGHSLILGSKDSNSKTILNFLISQSRRFNPKIFYFDFNKESKCFIKAVGGKYYSLERAAVDSPDFLKINPILLPKNLESQNFLIEFFKSLIVFSKNPASEEELALIPQVVDRIISTNCEDFTSAVECFNTQQTKAIYDRLVIWTSEKLSHIFGSKDDVNWQDNTIAFDLTEVAPQKPILIPVVYYLLSEIEGILDGSPSIIVLNQAWEMLDNSVLGPKIKELLDRLSAKNVVVIFASNDPKKVAESALSPIIKNSFATKIFLPNHEMSKEEQTAYKSILGLNDDENEMIRIMDENEGHFLLKHGDDSIISSLNLSDNIELQKILAADEFTIAAMDEVIAANATEEGEAPSDVWVPQAFEVIKEIENERVAEEKEKLRQQRAAAYKRLKSSD